MRLCYALHTLFVWTRTDTFAILVLRWTEHQPIYEEQWPERRGIPHRAIEPTFPPEWHAIRQWEENPSLAHTFSWTGWPDQVTRWFMFTAPELIASPGSQAGIFHFTSPLPPFLIPLYVDGFSTLPCAAP